VLKVLKWALAFIMLSLSIYILNTQPTSIDHQQFIDAAQNYKARIIRDDFGVPHVYGERDMDVAFGLAYAHSEDDFSTIQDIILVVRGMMSAKNGMDSAVTDYLIQWMNVWGQVDSQYLEMIPKETRDVIDAYAAGVNLYAAEHPDEIDPWLLPVHGKDVVAGFVFKTPLFYGLDSTIAALADGQLGTGLDKSKHLEVTTKVQPEIGSQGIAINRNRSSDNAVRLLVNSHQPLTGPVAWYEARLKSNEGIDMVGGTFPGSPFILNGSGPALGWSSTVNKPDLIDIYRLKINPDNENQYWLDGKWFELEQKSAAIKIKLFGPLYWTVNEPIFYSAHGPVMKFDHGVYALRWAGMNEIRQTSFFHKLNRAKTIDAFKRALAMNAMPSINYVYADSDGNIAHFYNAMMPDRSAEPNIDWQSILPGDNSALIWDSYVKAVELPRTVNPLSGAVFNANNTPFVSSDGDGAPISNNFPQWMGVELQMTNRAHQILSHLKRFGEIDATTFHDIKMNLDYDPQSLPIIELNSFLSAGLPSELSQNEDYQRAYQHLKSWDLRTNIDNKHAALGVLTLYPLINHHTFGFATMDMVDSFKLAVDSLLQHHGKIDVTWGMVNRLVRGQQSWPMSGGPDILRAVYGWPLSNEGTLEANTGDSYIQFSTWPENDSYQVSSINTYGAAMTRPESKHYADQSPLFAAGKERIVAMELVKLLEIATSDITIGKVTKQ